MSRKSALSLLLISALLLGLLGCEEDSSTTPQLGIVVITGGPDETETPWRLRLPGGIDQKD